MPALNFQKQFALKVESGEKRQTIRAYRVNGRDPKKGDTLYHYTGMRTKACKKLLESVCKDTRDIIIFKDSVYMGPLCDNTCQKLSDYDKNKMAMADGFETYKDFQDFFAKRGLPFYGLLIKW